MSNTDDVDTVFDGIDIEGQNPKVQESEGESKGTMTEESSGSQDEIEDTSIDTDFSGVDIEGSTPVADSESPVISTGDTGLNSSASETWGNGEQNIRVDEEELSRTVETETETGSTSDKETSEPESKSGSNETSSKTDGDTEEPDTDFSDVHIDGSKSDAETGNSENEVSEESRTHAGNQSESPSSGSKTDSTESTTDLADEIAKEVTTEQLSEVSGKQIRSPLEILTGPFRSIINTGEWILRTFFELVIIWLISTGYMAKIGIGLGVLTYGILTASIIVFPPLVEMRFVANGVVAPNPTRLELFMLVSLVYIPLLLILKGFMVMSNYLKGDSGNSSTEEKSGFSRW